MPQDDHRRPQVVPLFSKDNAPEPSGPDPIDETLAALRAQALLEGAGSVSERRRSLAQCVFCTVSKLFRPARRNSLVESWLPALDGVVEKLDAGVRVADLGCSHGHGTLIMAEAFPRSEFVGFDDQVTAVDIARRHAARHGLDNIRFETARPADLARDSFDLVTCFDWLHARRNPSCVARQVRQALTAGGTWMIVEPGYLADEPAASDPASDLRTLVAEAGFSRFRQAAETPFNTILEARP